MIISIAIYIYDICLSIINVFASLIFLPLLLFIYSYSLEFMNSPVFYGGVAGSFVAGFSLAGILCVCITVCLTARRAKKCRSIYNSSTMHKYIIICIYI